MPNSCSVNIWIKKHWLNVHYFSYLFPLKRLKRVSFCWICPVNFRFKLKLLLHKYLLIPWADFIGCMYLVLYIFMILCFLSLPAFSSATLDYFVLFLSNLSFIFIWCISFILYISSCCSYPCTTCLSQIILVYQLISSL